MKIVLFTKQWGICKLFNLKLLVVLSLFIFSGCNELEPEMQDKRTVILNMDFNKRSSSQTSPNISSSDLSQYNTHLIIAVPVREYLTNNYLSYFYSSFDAGLMNTQDRRVNMEVPLNTEMKIFAFLFQGNYSMNELIQSRDVGYYGQSGSFYINNQTNYLSIGVNLMSTGSTSGGESTGIIEEVTAIGTSNHSRPDYTFASTIAGTITYGGSCSSTTTSAIVGNNVITFNTLSNGTYSNCTIKVTDSSGNESNILSITAFTVLDTTLLAHYAFEGNLNDNSSYDRHLEGGVSITFTSVLTQYNLGFQTYNSRSAYFNGVNTYAYTNNISIGNTDNFTIAFWIRPSSSDMSQWDSVMSTGDVTSGNRFQIDYSGNNKLRFGSMSVTIEETEWQHFVFTKITDDTDTQKIRVYKDGVLQTSDSPVTTRWDKLKIGLNRSGGGFWKGWIDEFRLYNRPFSSTEVEELYNSY